MAASQEDVIDLGVTVSPHSISDDATQVLSQVRRNWRRQDVRFKVGCLSIHQNRTHRVRSNSRVSSVFHQMVRIWDIPG
jgi:radical SAM superfamily enzyme